MNLIKLFKERQINMKLKKFCNVIPYDTSNPSFLSLMAEFHAFDNMLDPAAQIIILKIPEAYRAGATFASIQLGAPLELRKDEWKRIGTLVQGNKDAFAKITVETSGRIRSIIADGIVNERSFGPRSCGELTRALRTDTSRQESRKSSG